MALGGIPVSGGATGHGTLIYCNLLYYPLRYDAYGVPIARPSFTLGGTAGIAQYEAAYVVDKDPKTLYKTAASAGDITLAIDLGTTGLTVYGIGLIGHNLTVTNIGGNYARLMGGTTNACADVTGDLVLNADTLTPAYHLLASPIAKKYWQILVKFAGSTALQIGEIFLIGAAPYAFEKNYVKGFTNDRERGKVSGSGISGVPRVYTRWKRQRLAISFNMVSTAQLTALQDAADNGHVIFSPEGSSSYAYFGTIEIEPPTYISADKWDVRVSFTEASK